MTNLPLSLLALICVHPKGKSEGLATNVRGHTYVRTYRQRKSSFYMPWGASANAILVPGSTSACLTVGSDGDHPYTEPCTLIPLESNLTASDSLHFSELISHMFMQCSYNVYWALSSSAQNWAQV